MTCKNCGREFQEIFCPNCGQRKTSNSRLELFALIKKFVDDEFDLHRGFFYTLWQLSYKPGTVARSYVQGMRKRYTAPTRFLIITLAFQALIDYLSAARELIREYYAYYPSLIPERFYDDMQYYNYLLGTEYALSVNVAQLFLFPIAFRIFFRKFKYNYTELLVVSFYFISIALIYNIIFSFIMRHVFGLYLSGDFITLFMVAILSWAYVSFFEDDKPFLRVIKVLASLAIIILFRIYIVPFVLSYFFPVSTEGLI